MNLSSTWTVPEGEVELCLNGHKITGGFTDTSLIEISEGAVLRLYECQTTEHQGYYKKDGADVGLWTEGMPSNGEEVMNIAGGIITGGNATWGGAIEIKAYGKLYMYGGTICGNKAEVGGGFYFTRSASDGNHLNVCGSIRIQGNTNNENAVSNLFIEEGAVISAFQSRSGMSVGITMNGYNQEFAEGASQDCMD